MTTWVIVDQPKADRLTVKYTSDDGTQHVTMIDLWWDQVTPIELWLGRINPWPQPPNLPKDKVAPPPLVGMTGTSEEPDRTPPVPPPELDPMRPFVTTPPNF